MPTRLDSRQVEYRGSLDQLTTAAVTELDNLLSAANAELTPPLRILPQTPASRTITIGALTIANPETGRNTSIPPISNLIPTFAGATITFPSSSGGSITGSPLSASYTLTLATGQYIKVGLALDANGNVVLTFGTASTNGLQTGAGAPPTVSNTYSIGYVVLRNVSGTIQTITNANIYQYVGGGGGNGTGNANSILETLKNQFGDSPYNLLTPGIFANDGSAKVHVSSTGTYSLVTNTFNMTAGQTLVTNALTDATEFDSTGREISTVDVTLVYDSGAVDTAPTVQVSRDGGNEYQTATLARVGTTDTWTGTYRFATETTPVAAISQTSQDGQIGFNITTQLKHAVKIVLTGTRKVQKASIHLKRDIPTTGGVFAQLVRDSGSSSPSTAAADVLATSPTLNIATALTNAGSGALVDFDLSSAGIIPAGTYWVVVDTDAAYKAQYTGLQSIVWRYLSFGGSTDSYVYNGTTWSNQSAVKFAHVFYARPIDLRLKVTSSGTSRLSGFGVFYDEQDPGMTGYARKTQRFSFNSTVNTNVFSITSFTPDPDLLTCYWVEGGQAFKVPAFTLSGNTATFPANTFANGGISQQVTLIFDQNTGGAYDNSDTNSRLMADNHLGSTDANLDRSVAGRGIYLRRPDGTLRELGLDDNDNLVIYSV